MAADFSGLHPVFVNVLQEILSELGCMGWQPKVVSAMRTSAEQAKKVKEGHSKTMKSWHVPSTAGILAESGSSYSIVSGFAADIVDSRYGWNGPAKNRKFKFWTDLGRIAKAHGCEWGGDWKSFPDVAHIQYLMIEGRTQDRIAV